MMGQEQPDERTNIRNVFMYRYSACIHEIIRTCDKNHPLLVVVRCAFGKLVRKIILFSHS